MKTDSRLQLDFLDGLRALAALYVFIHHVAINVNAYVFGFRRGLDAVGLFIVISGFCLALPLARKNDWHLQALPFYKRRIRRILPPYYVTFIISLLVTTIWSHQKLISEYQPKLFFSDVLNSAILTQNWIHTSPNSINGPLWTVALECQIYLFLPLIALLRCRLGATSVLVIAFCIANGLFYATHHGGAFNYLFLFAEGVWGVDAAFSGMSDWKLIGIAVSLFLTYGATLNLPAEIPLMFFGGASACSLALLLRHRNSVIAQALGSRPLVWLGTFSYSFYLLHALFVLPAPAVLKHVVPVLTANPHALFLLVLLFTLPACYAIAFVFFRLVEEPFISYRRRRVADHLTFDTPFAPGNNSGT